MFVPAAVGAVHISEERRKHPADDVREAGALGLHLPELRLHQQGAGPDEVGQWEAAGGGEPGAVLRTHSDRYQNYNPAHFHSVYMVLHSRNLQVD